MPFQLRLWLRVGCLAAVLVAITTLAGEGSPVNKWAGSAPSGACAGNRVVVMQATGAQYCCASGIWAACDAAGGVPGGASTNLQTNDGSGGFGAYAGTVCTNQFTRSLDASGVATCSSVGIADHSATGTPSATTYLRGDNTWAAPSGYTPSGTQYGVPYYATSSTLGTTAAPGFTGYSLRGNKTGAPTWVRDATFIVSSSAQNFSSATAGTTNFSWSIAASATQAFQCILDTSSTATSLIRFAVNCSDANVTHFQYLGASTSVTTPLFGVTAGNWSSPCSNCTPAVTASVITTPIVWTLSGIVRSSTTGGTVTIMAAASTTSSTSTIQIGSMCWYTTL